MKNADNNLNFIKRSHPESFRRHFPQLKVIAQRFHQLTSDERLQWVQIHQLKCQQMFNLYEETPHHPQYKQLLLKQLITLTSISHQYGCNVIIDVGPYDKKAIQKFLKYFYYHEKMQEESHNEILGLFKEFNFDISDYDFLVYEDPWYSRILNWFSLE